MATTVTTLLGIIRRHLNETTASFWTDAELIALMNRGMRDLRRAINDNYQNYFLTVDDAACSIAASSGLVTGTPADVGIIRGLEARVPSNFPNLTFRPKDWNHPDFASARALGPQDPTQLGVIWWAATGAGAPVAAPVIRIAPMVSAAIPLTLSYVPSMAEITSAADPNPIPGESDQALIAWTVAYARAKEREDRMPDDGWLQVYSAEKVNILSSLTPRQTEEEEVAEALFESLW